MKNQNGYAALFTAAKSVAGLEKMRFENHPLCCPKCRQESLTEVKNLRIIVITEPITCEIESQFAGFASGSMIMIIQSKNLSSSSFLHWSAHVCALCLSANIFCFVAIPFLL